MQDDDLFEVIPPALDADPWDHPPTLKLRTDLLDRLRGSVPGNPVVCPSADPAGPSRTRGVRHGRRGKAEICPRAQYVGYTATPFANVFVDPDDETRPVSRRLRPLAAPTARLHGSPGVPPGAGRLVLSVSAKVVGAWDVDPVHSYGWRRRGVGLDWMEIPAPARGFVHIRSHFRLL